MALSDLLQGCSERSVTVMITRMLQANTSLTTQGCNNIALYHGCIKLVGTTLQQV